MSLDKNQILPAPWDHTIESTDAQKLRKQSSQAVFSRVALEAPMSSQHRIILIEAVKYVDADASIREALLLFNERLFDVDKQVSYDVIIGIATFFVTYARVLINGDGERDVRVLLDTRKAIFAKLAELDLKVSYIHAESAYEALTTSLRAALTSCMAALWAKHGYVEAVEMYRPLPHFPDLAHV